MTSSRPREQGDGMAMDHIRAASDARTPPPGSSPRLETVEIGDTKWKRLTEKANQAYTQGDIPLARAAYEDALTEAEQLFDAALLDGGSLPVPVIYNVSCHNLAELEARQGNPEAAEVYFRKAYDRLLATARSPASPLPLRMACVQHLKHALVLLAQHLQARQAPDEVMAEIVSKAHETAFSVFRIAKHAELADAQCPHCPITPS